MAAPHLQHRILETADLTSAIDRGVVEWPGLTRSEVVQALILKGAESLDYQAATRAISADWALSDLASLEIHYPEGYLDDLREGWDRHS